jgi:hypothetical protein
MINLYVLKVVALSREGVMRANGVDGWKPNRFKHIVDYCSFNIQYMYPSNPSEMRNFRR